MDATHAWDIGYYFAVRGINKNIPQGTWLVRFTSDWAAGYESAINEGKWGTHNGS